MPGKWRGNVERRKDAFGPGGICTRKGRMFLEGVFFFTGSRSGLAGKAVSQGFI